MNCPRVLHVSEAFGGGVTTAMMAYVRNSAHAEHHLLAKVREVAAVSLPDDAPFASVRALPSGWRQAISSVRAAYRALRPDFVHLHSSYAGAFGRLALLPRSKIIYTPHCFAFERCDLSYVSRAAYYCAEQILSLGGARIAGVSPRETILGRHMVGTSESLLLPNHATAPAILRGRRILRAGRPTFAAVGRLTAQKDPHFFLTAVRHLRARGLDADFLWLGGGDSDVERDLRAAGIEVSGWVSNETVFARLAQCDVYVHTAAWEGSPISLLEAAALGLPIAARDIPALRSLGLRNLSRTSAELAERLASLISLEERAAAAEDSERIDGMLSRDVQEAALRALYGGAGSTALPTRNLGGRVDEAAAA